MSENLKLLLLYLAISAVILLRVAAEGNGYTTPDSHHYLAAAQSLADTGQLNYTAAGQERYFSLWPMGYPLSIAFVAKVTSLSGLWSSKIVNLLWLGAALLLLKKVCPQRSAWVGLAFGAHSVLEIFSYTWSEAGLMVTLFWFGIALHHFLTQENQKTEWGFQIFFSVVLAFLYRYFGGFLVGLLAFSGWGALLKKRWSDLLKLLVVSTGALGFMLLYFWHIQQRTGFYSGATRQLANESFSYLLTNLAQAQLNEFALIRKLDFRSPDWLAIGLLLFQVVVLGYAYRQVQKQLHWKTMLRPQLAGDSLPLCLMAVGAAYWVTMVGLRFFMKFDLFDFRLLTPASLLFLLALLLYFSAQKRQALFVQIRGPVAWLFVTALAHGLYKKQLLVWLIQ